MSKMTDNKLKNKKPDKHPDVTEKEDFKAGNMLYPVPAVLVSLADREGKPNIITVAWTGTICTNPAMLYISVRPERYSHAIIKETGEFVVNLTTEELVKAVDYCGVRSGRDTDKFKDMHLTMLESKKVKAPGIAESPVNIECRVKKIVHLGSHDMFIAEVVNVRVSKKYMNEKGTFELEKAKPIVYSHGKYLGLGKELGTFGYSVRKKRGQNEKNKYNADRHAGGRKEHSRGTSRKDRRS